jgi:hypothetical protein
LRGRSFQVTADDARIRRIRDLPLIVLASVFSLLVYLFANVLLVSHAVAIFPGDLLKYVSPVHEAASRILNSLCSLDR